MDAGLAIHDFNSGVGDVEERRELRTTHRRVWHGAQLLLRCLLSEADTLGLNAPNLRILELVCIHICIICIRTFSIPHFIDDSTLKVHEQPEHKEHQKLRPRRVLRRRIHFWHLFSHPSSSWLPIFIILEAIVK